MLPEHVLPPDFSILVALSQKDKPKPAQALLKNATWSFMGRDFIYFFCSWNYNKEIAPM